MRFRTLASLAATASIMAFVPAMASAAPQDFTLDNATGYDIANLFVGPTSSDDWGDDVLGEDVLKNGEAVKIHFPDGRGETCQWDLKITYTDKTTHEWRNVDLCSIASITVHYDEAKDETSATSTPAE